MQSYVCVSQLTVLWTVMPRYFSQFYIMPMNVVTVECDLRLVVTHLRG